MAVLAKYLGCRSLVSWGQLIPNLLLRPIHPTLKGKGVFPSARLFTSLARILLADSLLHECDPVFSHLRELRGELLIR
ncbi:MAG: hypothetical protein K0S45_1799 [Nitrospira sp.]|nr:hypothetical protein [Nitrospira sp.]